MLGSVGITRITRVNRSYKHIDAYKFTINLCTTLLPWILWKERCKRIFEEKSSTVNSIFMHLLWLLRNLSNLHIYARPRNRFLCDYLSDVGICCNQPRSVMPKFVKWYPPDKTTMKLNFDGASRGNPGSAGGGFIVRNHTGHVVLFGSSNYGVVNNMEAELKAMHDGLLLIYQFNLHEHPFVIETDSQAIVKSINSNIMHWNTWYIWNRIKILLQGMKAQVVHIYREANAAADCLANIGIDNSCAWSNNPQLVPRELRGILLLDRIGLGTFRGI